MSAGADAPELITLIDGSQESLDQIVADLLGRRPQGRYEVAVARSDGTPVVLVNDPFLDSGRPMPTRYWLLDPMLNKAIGTLEAEGGVKSAESSVDPAELAATHDRYRRERDREIPADHLGPSPSGGVGGTRTGVKCLHAHYGYFLAGGDDPVGRWVDERLSELGKTLDGLVVVQKVPSEAKPVFLIEIGSGSLKVLRADGNDLRRGRYPTDLLAETTADGTLTPRGREMLSKALDDAKALCGNVAPTAIVATEVLRAHPSHEVAQLVADRLGADVEVLDGQREAGLGYLAATGGVEGSSTVVTVDVGYGSTEFAAVGPDGSLVTMSLPIGASTITSTYLASDPPRADELSAALSVIELHLDDLRREQPFLAERLAAGDADIVGLGAVRYVAEVELGRAGDDIDGYVLEHGAVEEVFRALATESAEDRAFNPGLRAEHIGWIVGAMCILVETMRQFGISSLRTSIAGILDGLLAEHRSLER